MAERDQLVGAFTAMDAGDAGGAQHIALLGIAGQHQGEGVCRS